MVAKLLRFGLLIALVALWVVLILGYLAFYKNYNPIRTPLAVIGVVSAVIVIIAAGPWFREGVASPSLFGTWGLRISGALAVAVLGLIEGGKRAGYVGPGTAEPPASIVDPLAQPAEVLAYAQGLTYADGAHDYTHHSEDEQWLEVRDSKDSTRTRVDSILGPRARITPEANSLRNSRKDLGIGRGKGRIVARIWVDTAYRRANGHEKLRLPTGTSYLWIDGVAATGDSVSMRAIIFSANQPPVLVPNAYYAVYKRMWASYPQARWQFNPKDPCMCDSCALHGWCMVCGG